MSIIGEGGGPNPPYGEDFFDRIVGVHWRRKEQQGGIFAFGYESVEGSPGKTVYGEVFLGADNWMGTGSHPNAVRSNAYGADVFVAGGGWIQGGSIQISTDGKTWSQVYSSGSGLGGGGVQNIVWDGTMFHAIDEVTTSDSIYWEAKILSSSNGTSWGAGGSFIAGTSEEFENQYNACSDAFKALCPYGIPSGYFGYDAEKNILMTPIDFEVHVRGVGIDSNSIQISGGPYAGTKSFNLRVIRGIAFGGGVWAVIGWSDSGRFTDGPYSIFTSMDDGGTWQQSFSGTAWAINGIAGRAR